MIPMRIDTAWNNVKTPAVLEFVAKGMITGFITSFAKKFYKHRQKRWQIVASNNLKFGQ